jgi:uncharacterized protein YkwD
MVAAAVVIVSLFSMWRNIDSDSTANIEPIDLEIVSWVNGERRWNGVATIPIDGDLTSQAQLQANRMAACGCIHHSPRGELGWWLNQGWWEVAENVGYTNGAGVHALFALHVAFIASPSHRDNMLNPAHRGIGLAVRQGSDGRLWVAQFYGGF